MSLSMCRCFGRGLVAPSPLNLLLVRGASKKAGGSSRNHGGKSPGKRYGVKKYQGEFVHAGNILATQRLMRWHPGSQVGIGRNNTLFALEDGIVRYTKEVYIPPPYSTETENVICQLPVGAVLYKTFINVIPTRQNSQFQLVDMM
ncbi:39S ribosomal protein L27, mitochondrial [Bombina bombina]|uniref:39S ribosomal protein L27, mitochondrial n=1 Tax=Bombina bombina TaxID=8345 RepID=UPI00235AFFFC|nr:39S ribosomal protein L27, mitochondrial [Bombina bombina]